MDNFTDISNHSLEEEGFIPYSARVETYLVPILFSLIFFVGIVGNWTVCIIFIRHPSMRNVPNTYVSWHDSLIFRSRKKETFEWCVCGGCQIVEIRISHFNIIQMHAMVNTYSRVQIMMLLEILYVWLFFSSDIHFRNGLQNSFQIFFCFALGNIYTAGLSSRPFSPHITIFWTEFGFVALKMCMWKKWNLVNYFRNNLFELLFLLKYFSAICEDFKTHSKKAISDLADISENKSKSNPTYIPISFIKGMGISFNKKMQTRIIF
jgi:hypothetical protein